MHRNDPNHAVGALVALVLCSPCSLATAQDLPSPFELGPFAAGHRVLDLTYPCGRTCSRTIPVDAWYPVDAEDAVGPLASYRPMVSDPWTFPSDVAFQDAQPSDAGPFPLVIFSHGYGGFGAAFSDLGEHLASHGFIVAAPSHAGNTPGEPDEPDLSSLVRTRRNDLAQVIDRMLAENDLASSPFAGRINPERIGAAGHSFGAGAVMVASGGASSPSIGSFDDPRIRAVFAISSYVPGNDSAQPGPSEPVYMLSGTLDPVRNDYYAYPGMSTVPRYYTEIDGANHNSYQDFCSRSEYAQMNGAPQAVLNLYDDSHPIFGGTCDPDTISNDTGVQLTNMLATSFFKTYLSGEGEYSTFLSRAYANAAELPLLVNATILGDTDRDSDVDLDDLNAVRNNFGVVDPENSVIGDTNLDHVVDLTDLNNVRNNFTGNGQFGAEFGESRGARPVPEPQTWALALQALVAVLGTRCTSAKRPRLT